MIHSPAYMRTQARKDFVVRMRLFMWPVVGMACAAAVAAWQVQSRLDQLALASVSVTLLLVAAIIVLEDVRHRRQDAFARRTIMQFLEHDSSAALLTDTHGAIRFQNRVALDMVGAHPGGTISQALRDLVANPDAVSQRLRARAEVEPIAKEDIVTRRGQLRCVVQKQSHGFLWRVEQLAEPASRSAEGVAVPMMTVSRSGAILHMNEPLLQSLGVRSKRLQDIFDDLPLVSGNVHALRIGETTQAVRVFKVDSFAGRSEVYVFPESENAARQDPQFAEDFDGLPVPVLSLTPSGEVLRANRLALSLLPQVMQPNVQLPALLEGLGKSVSNWISDAGKGRGLNRSEVMRVTGSAPDQFLQVTLGRVMSDGQPTLLAVLNDATELKTLEAQFVQSQKMQAIGQLAGGVAHDFNNLLTAISGHCDLLLLRHDHGDEDYGDLVQISQNANRAAALVGQLLAFSRKQTLQLERLDLRDALGDLTHLLNRLVGERVLLNLVHDPGLAPIRADRRQLEQVMMNLVVNARDAMPEGGEIKIETTFEYLDKALERDRVAVPAGQYTVVRVVDQGTGIPEDKLSKIFEPFFTSKRLGEGTGLGLSMAYGIVKQTGGFIFADNRPEGGAVFSLFFPVIDEDEETDVVIPQKVAQPASPLPSVNPDPVPSDKTASRADPVTPQQVSDASKKVVLLVEDEAPVRAFASRALKLRGFQVVEAACAEDALEILTDQSLVIDLIVTDVMMPGMDGPSWVRIALKERPTVRTIFVSGYAQEAFGEGSAEVPNSVFLPKPFSLAELTQTVQSQLH